MFGHPVAQLLAPPAPNGPFSADHRQQANGAVLGETAIGEVDVEESELPWTHQGALRALATVSRTGQSPPSRRTFLLITGAGALVPAAAWLRKRPDPDTAGFGARRVTGQTLGALRDRLGQLRRLDDEHGTIVLLPAITGDLAYVVSLLKDAAYSETIGRRLQGCAAGLARLTGWGHYEAGRDDLAQRALQAALRGRFASGCQNCVV